MPIRIEEFDVWQPGYGAATVRVLQANTTILASIYSDEDLTVAVANPVTLIERISSDNISYGRFQSPIYVGVPYQLQINSVDTTGVQRIPLTTLEDQDASLATVTVTGGSEQTALQDIFARSIDVRDHGEFLAVGSVGASRATNTTSLTTAIGEAAGRGSAYVDLPAGTFQIANIAIPAGVVLRGEGRDATILQSNQAGNVATITGDGAGFTRLTLDGVTLVTNSVGVRAVDCDRIVFDDVMIKRFETGLSRDGGAWTNWRDLSISDCATGYKAYGTTAILKSNTWTGGRIELCTAYGLDLRYDGKTCDSNRFIGVLFDTNTGIAVGIKGATTTSLRDCVWTANTTDLAVSDYDLLHQVNGIEITDGSITAGAMTFTGRMENIFLRRTVLAQATVTITTPTNAVQVEDCTETSVTIGGSPGYWHRNSTDNVQETFITTTNVTATRAWAMSLSAGDQVYLEAKVIGRQINAVNNAFYHFTCLALMPAMTLHYDSLTTAFTPGRTITGATSGATAVLVAGGNTPLVAANASVVDVVGIFLDNEIITDGAGGSATVDGPLSQDTYTSIYGGPVVLASGETNVAWACTFAATANEIEVRVTGAASATIEWTVQVEVTKN